MKYTHIVFDIDGTMLDSAFADLSALQQVLHEYLNKEFKQEELQFALGIPGEVALAQLGIKDTAAANKLWGRYMTEHSHSLRLFDGIKDLIISLKKEGVNLGIITSKNRTEYLSDFAPFGLDSYFDTIICVDDCAAPKPSPHPMYAYLKKSGAVPQEVLYIGDTIYDSKCATGAGVDFGLAVWGCSTPKHIIANYYFNTPQDIKNELDKEQTAKISCYEK